MDEIVVEGGQHVEKGDLILRFSNTALQQQTIGTETQLLYNLDIQRDSQFNRAQNALVLRDTLLDLETLWAIYDSRTEAVDALSGD